MEGLCDLCMLHYNDPDSCFYQQNIINLPFTVHADVIITSTSAGNHVNIPTFDNLRQTLKCMRVCVGDEFSIRACVKILEKIREYCPASYNDILEELEYAIATSHGCKHAISQ